MDDDKVLFVVAGTFVLLVAGLFLYNVMLAKKKESESLLNTVSMTLENDFSVSQTPRYPAIVQNEERVTWTDWLGRERVITISRVVH